MWRVPDHRAPRRAVCIAGVVVLMLAGGPAVAAAQQVEELAECENDPGLRNWMPDEKPWARDWLKLEQVHRHATGAGVTVAVLDTGVDWTNAHMQDVEYALGSEIDVTDEHSRSTARLDCDGHGTEVASLIAGQEDEDSSQLLGVAPDATIMPVKTQSDRDERPIDDLVQGIEWAVDEGAHIINISITTDSNYEPLWHAIKYAGDNGVLVVVAAGNEGPRRLYPAAMAADPAFDHVISVGAVRRNSLVWEESGHSAVTVTAPGVEVLTAWPVHGNDLSTGTSFAAPIVSGVAALVLEASDKELTPAELKRRIEVTADPAPGADVPDVAYGYGLINPLAAVTAALPDAPDPEADASTEQVGFTPALPPGAADHTDRDRALAISGGALGLVITVMCGVAIVRKGSARGWRPGRPARPTASAG